MGRRYERGEEKSHLPTGSVSSDVMHVEQSVTIGLANSFTLKNLIYSYL